MEGLIVLLIRTISGYQTVSSTPQDLVRRATQAGLKVSMEQNCRNLVAEQLLNFGLFLSFH